MAFDPEKDGAPGVVDGFCELRVTLVFDQAADGGAEGGEHGEDVDALRGRAEGVVLEEMVDIFAFEDGAWGWG